ncbi:MAG: beta-ketoacyl synthase N-terminal-like domain-containing protein [Planctomycetaceae bacterium]
MRSGRALDIAIVGLACRFPGARDAAGFWEGVVLGRDATGDVPRDRWDPAVFLDPGSDASDRVYTQRGGYLDAPIAFDAAAQGIMPNAVEGGEPEQFLVLDTARAALADAGLGDGVRDGRRVEVVIGRGNYFNRGNLTRLQHGRIVAQTLAILRDLHPDWTEADFEAIRADLKAGLPPFGPATIPGQLTNATAGRIADRLDLRGASYVVDAASASALVALDLGARALVDRRADLALVGAVYLAADVDFPMVFCRLGALSRTGKVRPFAREADGTLPGEGVGVVVLKRLRDAGRDGDRIYAVLKSVGIAGDGRGRGLATPGARGHVRAIRRAYRGAGIDPGTVGLIEGHGLGVPASDRAELRALRAVFPPAAGPGPRRVLGSVSALIGHAMPAAGMAGLIKSALALHHRVIPPSPTVGAPHPLLADPSGPLALNASARPWIHGARSHPRRAGVNAFGFAGISAHAVLEEHAPSADGLTPGCQPRWETEAILIDAPDRAGWLARARRLRDWLGRGANASVALKDLAFTLNTAPGIGPFRVGLVVSSTADLAGRLGPLIERLADPDCRSIRDARGAYFRAEPLAGPRAVAFLFPGEGSQYPGMLADLCAHFPEVRALFDTSDRVARALGHARLPSAALFEGAGGDEAGLWSVGTAINVVLSAQWALYQLLTRLGLRPDAVVGHSSGELLALAAAGAVAVDREFEDKLGAVGTTFERLESSGQVPTAALVAIGADRARVEAACREVGHGLSIAMDNCPHQVVVAGPEDAAEALVRRLRPQGVMCEYLPFARAYHTPGFLAALGPVRELFGGLPLSRPEVPIYSCAIAGRMSGDVEWIRRLAVEQWVLPVSFRATVEAMHADGARIFVEVGARGGLTGFVEDTLRGRPHFAIAANLPRRPGLTQLNHLVAALFAHGVALRPDLLYARRRPERLDLENDRPRPEPAPALAVGFPEMRLSPGLAASLRARRTGGEPVPAPEPPADRAGDRRAGPPSVPTPTHSSGPNGDGRAPEPVRRGPGGRVAAGRGAGPPAQAGSRPALSRPPREDTDRRTSSRPRGEAMLAFLRTMDEFLEAQRQVMEAYIAASKRPGGPQVAPEPASRMPRPDEVERPGRPAPPSPATAPAESVAEAVLDRVARRTGYPRAMLQLDLDLEADLGIDSIKRVEILNDLQGAGIVPAGVDLDRLSRSRTLRQVLEGLGPGPAERPAPGAEPGPWVGSIESLEPGRSLVAVRRLDASDDPVAEHHTLGGRRVSALDPSRKGLPVVPFTVMAEMIAEAAAVLAPGRAVVALRDVVASKWIRYEEAPVVLELRAARDGDRPDEVRVEIHNRGASGSKGPNAGEGPVATGRVGFGPARPAPPPAGPFALEDVRACRFTADELYRDQWLFHGPALRALVAIGRSSPGGIEGTLRVLPRRGLLRARERGAFRTDPIVLDAFTHLLGCWGLDEKADGDGDVIFPLRLGSLTIFGSDPPEGTEVACRIAVRAVTRHTVRADAEFVTPDGRVWMRIEGWDDWRFYWPGRYRDQFRQPDRVFLGEPIAMPGADGSGLMAVWLEPPADMGKPVWRDVLEWVQLGPEERAALRAPGGPEPRLTLRLWGRIAAKEAARRLWADQGHPPAYPADLAIEPDPRGRPRLRSLIDPARGDLPAVSIAHTDGVAVALAARDPRARVGIDVERIVDRSPGFEDLAFSEGERALLDRLAGPGSSRAEWVARLWCAKEAVAKASGQGMAGGPKGLSAIEADAATGEVAVAPGPDLAAAWPEAADRPIGTRTARRGEYVLAWAVVDGGDGP